VCTGPLRGYLDGLLPPQQGLNGVPQELHQICTLIESPRTLPQHEFQLRTMKLGENLFSVADNSLLHESAV
jgi:hypothetical protein